jgi:DNA-binding NarL/FixJ family response regulator
MVAVQRVRLLLVDDNEEFLRAESAWIGAQPGYEVVATARSGEAALDAAERLRPDVVLMDLAMPGMGGFEAIRALKQRPAPPAVIAVSLYDSQAVRGEASMAGADDFVPKARLSTLLVPALRGVHGASRLAPEAARGGSSPREEEAGDPERRPRGPQDGAPSTPGAARGARRPDAGPWARLRTAVAARWMDLARPRTPAPRGGRKGFTGPIGTTPR